MTPPPVPTGASSAAFAPVTGEIVPAELEGEFRAWSHADHARRTRSGVLASGALMVAFCLADFEFLGWSAKFAALAIARGASAIVAIVWAARIAKSDPRSLDRGLFAWTLSAVAIVLASLATRPAGFVPSVISTTFVALMAYTILPNRFVHAVVCGLTVCAGYLVVASRAGLNGTARAVIALVFLLVNTTGAAVNSWLARLARSEFLRMRATEEAHSERLSFLAATSHEIRSPLHAIVACVDLLTATDLTREQRNLVSLIRSSSDGMVGLLEEAVNQVRGDDAPPVIQLAEFDLAAMLGETAALMRARAAVRNIDVTTRVDESVPRFVRADRARIRQILLNLAENALAHGARERIELFAACPFAQGESGTVEIEFGVIDDGPGVDPTMRDQIFRPFVRATRQSEQARGMGLGLAICARLARAMGGRMAVGAAIGGGARFSLHVPLELASGPARTEPKPALPGTKLALLVVEDDPVSGHLMTLLLECDGHLVTLATSAERALEQIEQRRFDAIITDLRLPGMSGVEAVGRIRARWGAGPVIAMSAHISRGDHDELLRAGCVAVLPKPMALDRLRAVLDRVEPGQPVVPAHRTEVATFDERVLDLHVELLGAAKVASLLRMFVQTSATTMTAIGEAVSREDAASVASQLHRLASAASSAGLSACAQIAGDLEAAIREGGTVDRETVEALRRVHERSCAVAIVRAETLEKKAA